MINDVLGALLGFIFNNQLVYQAHFSKIFTASFAHSQRLILTHFINFLKRLFSRDYVGVSSDGFGQVCVAVEERR